MTPVGFQRRRGETPPGREAHLRRQLVADEADHSGSRQHAEMRQVLRMDEALHRLVEGDAGRHEDCRHDRKPGEPLATHAPQEEGDSERDGGERVAEVVNQIRQEGNRVREREDDDLHPSRHAKDQQAERDRLDPGAGAEDRTIDEAVRVVMAVRVVVIVVIMAVMIVAIAIDSRHRFAGERLAG